MTLSTLLLIVGAIAIVLTGLVAFVQYRTKNLFVSFLQNYCGVLFLVSGWVKAIDPLGTAYKMEQYFDAFAFVVEGTSFTFMDSWFDALASMSTSIAVIMIVLEMMLGVMLIIGAYRHLTAWLYFLIILFFTFLTGYTYLTGYVPDGVNFFDFSNWGAYNKTAMKVTDCGCFGDFIKLDPKISYIKDLVFLIPATIFLLKWRQMHELFTPNVRASLTLFSLLGFSLLCFSNFVWDLPSTDFRPFHEGANIREEKKLEEEAAQNVDINYLLTNKMDGRVVELSMEQFLNDYKNYPKDDWEYQQIKGEPTIPHTKISEFSVTGIDGNDVTEDLLNNHGKALMIIALKIPHKTDTKMVMQQDSVFAQDTIMSGDSLIINPVYKGLVSSEVEENIYTFPESYLERYRNHLLSLAANATRSDADVYIITKPSEPQMLVAFQKALEVDYPIYTADDILLKTIIRSNPGPVLMDDATILKKWHWQKIPKEEKQEAYFKED